jgi:hypothetical protein
MMAVRSFRGGKPDGDRRHFPGLGVMGVAEAEALLVVGSVVRLMDELVQSWLLMGRCWPPIKVWTAFGPTATV